MNSPSLPNIAAIADTSRGKRSALADLRAPRDRAAFADVLGAAHVMFQGLPARQHRGARLLGR